MGANALSIELLWTRTRAETQHLPCFCSLSKSFLPLSSLKFQTWREAAEHKQLLK